MKKISFQTDILPLKNQLYRLALRITLNPAEAEDVVQETMLKVWNRRQQWEQIDSIEAFCLTICRNLALDKSRLMANRLWSEATPADEPPDPSYAANPEEQAVRHDQVSRVRQLISQLPEKQRTAMELRDIEGKSYKDIAAIMAITEEQVKVSIFRGRQSIKKTFKKQEEYGL